MPWDTSMKTREPEEKAHIVFTRFACPDTKLGIKYSLGGLYVQSIVKHVSVNALSIIRNNIPNAVIPGEGVDYDLVKDSKRLGITREHVIPVEDLFNHFYDLNQAHTLTEKTILDFLPKLEIAIITAEENEKLRAAGLSKKMPKDWWESKTLDPFERYRAAGLDNGIWATEFLPNTATKKPQMKARPTDRKGQ